MLLTQGRRIVLLSVTVLFLGGYAYLTTPETQKTVKEEALQPRVFEFDPQKVVRVEILHEEEGLICQHTPEGWKVEPGMKELRARTMTDFLQSLAGLVEIGEIAGGEKSLPEYGLDHPPSRIVLHFEEGDSRALALGLHNPVYTSVYARVDETPRVVLVGSVILWEVRKLFAAAKGQRVTG